MTQQIAIYDEPPRLLRTRDVTMPAEEAFLSQLDDGELLTDSVSSDAVTPIDDAVWAQARLSWMSDGDLSRLGFEQQLNERQNGRVISRFRGSYFVKATSPRLTLGQAKERVRRAGINEMEVYEGIREQTLDLMIHRRLEIERLRRIVARADKGLGTQFLLGVTALGTEFADPINLATMLVPVVGEGKIAYWIAKIGARLGPTLSKFAVRAGVGAYEGTIGTAVLEPLNIWLHRELGDEYDMVDSLINVGLGAAVGGAFHAFGGALGDLFRRVRARVGPTIDEYGRIINEALKLIGRGHPIKEILPIVEKPSLLPQPTGEAAGFTPKVRDTGKFPKDSILAAPSHETGGDRATDSDLIALKEVLLDYHPVDSAGDLSETYRVLRDGEMVVYTRSAQSPQNVQIFTVQRLERADGEDLPLSKKRADAGGSISNDKRQAWVKPPTDLAKTISDAVDAKLDELLQLADEYPESLLKFSPEGKRGGHNIVAEVGDAVHVALSKYADASADLHRGVKLRGNEENYTPDLFHLRPEDAGLTNIEVKVNTDSGRAKGLTQSRGYKANSGRETVVLLYDLSPAQWAKVDKLNQKITDVWDMKKPGWRKEQTATKAGAAPKERKSTRRSKRTSTRKKRRKHAKDESPDESSPNSCHCP